MSPIIRPFKPRDPQEHHRAGTPLELFFDLVSVIAIAAAAAGLHHSIVEAHTLQGIVTFVMAFFAIWWAWMNYTWFASAYDNDDAPFRLLTILIISGSLTMAAGISNLFKSFDLKLIVIGYTIMRLGMIALWLRAAKNDPDRRSVALTYAAGLGCVQLLWIGYFLLQPLTPLFGYGLYFLLVIVDLAIPMIAEKKNSTPWHRHHIIERYGLLIIIALGESLLAAVLSLQQLADGTTNSPFVNIAVSSLVIVFSMWWLYFSQEEHLVSTTFRHAFVWAYGHIVIFASGAAVGAGLAVLVDVVAGHAKVSMQVGELSVAIPIAVYMTGLWFVRDRFHFSSSAQYVLPAFSMLLLLAPFTPLALEGIAALTATSIAVRSTLATRENAHRNI